MIGKKTMIVLLNMPALIVQYGDPSTRMRWGVLANPVLNNGNYLLPLGWEGELTKAGIDFEVKEVEIIEEIIEDLIIE